MSNGQCSDELGIFGKSKGKAAFQEEVFDTSLLSPSKIRSLAKEQSSSWHDLSQATLEVASGIYRNAWKSRFSFGGKESKAWQDEVRAIGEPDAALEMLNVIY